MLSVAGHFVVQGMLAPVHQKANCNGKVTFSVYPWILTLIKLLSFFVITHNYPDPLCMYTTKRIYCGIIFINEVQSSGAAKFFLVPGDVISLVASSDLNISYNKYYTNA